MKSEHDQHDALNSGSDPQIERLASQLKGLPVGPPQWNRDELMYRSGWAAARATREASPDATLSPRPRHPIWFWFAHIGTASVAAAVTLLISSGWWVQSDSSRPSTDERSVAAARPAEPFGAKPLFVAEQNHRAASSGNASMAQSRRDGQVPPAPSRTPRLTLSDFLWANPVTTNRLPANSRSNLTAWSTFSGESWSLEEQPSDWASSEYSPVTVQQLMDDLLPNRKDENRPPSSLFWRWLLPQSPSTSRIPL